MCIQYFIAFPRGVTQDGSARDPALALLDSGSEVNTIYPTFTEKLGFVVRTTIIGAQKINSTTLKTYGKVLAVFSVTDQADRVRFFEKIFLVANISLDVVLRMSFLTLSAVDVNFPKRELQWRSYTIEEVFPTTKRVELVEKKEFAAAALDPRHETFVMDVASLESPSNTQEDDVNPSRRAQIAALVVNEAPISVFTEYSDIANIFSPKLASKLFKHTGINDHTIELVDNWKPPYRPIYSLGIVELKTLKTYIETNLANGFIKPSKSPAGAPIFLIKS